MRHGGFIPWDDELDIGMLRDDYNRFMSIAKQELPEGYYIPPPRGNISAANLACALWNTREFPVKGALLEKFHGYFFPQGIDIFPFDYAAPDPESEELQKGLVADAFSIILSIDREEALLDLCQESAVQSGTALETKWGARCARTVTLLE